jgi:hypothetical protein
MILSPAFILQKIKMGEWHLQNHLYKKLSLKGKILLLSVQEVAGVAGATADISRNILQISKEHLEMAKKCPAKHQP